MKPTPGNHMKILRTFMRVKQKALCESLGISPPELAMYENEKRQVPIRFIQKFCDHFKITMSQFFSYDYRVLESASQVVNGNLL